MKLSIFMSMWGAPRSVEAALAQAAGAAFDGIEGPPPASSAERTRLRGALADHGLGWIAEVTTGVRPGEGRDWWAASPQATREDHLADLALGIDHAAEMGAWFVSSMCGYDAWGLTEQVEFFGRALDLARGSGVAVSFETHRGRSLFNPWITRDVLRQLPELQLTCDFSHWCVVAERLIDSEADIIELCASRARHVHARVGWAQGAQVPDPREPLFREALEAHERWWETVWTSQRERGMGTTTMTVEWGPDGYAPLTPSTNEPAVDLWDIVRWMGDRERQRFAAWNSPMRRREAALPC